MIKGQHRIFLFFTLMLLQRYQAIKENEKKIDNGINAENIDLSQENTSLNYYEQMIAKREKELEYEKIKQSGLNREKYLKQQSSEKEGWIYKNKNKLLKIFAISVSTMLVIFIGWKLYVMNLNIEEQNQSIRKQAKQMENIIDDTDNLVFVSWKDQKEGIIFFDNVAYKKQIEKDLSKQERLIKEIKQLEKEKIQRDQEIEKLKLKGQNYEVEIANLKEQYEDNKKKVLDEGCALGYAAPVLREFK